MAGDVIGINTAILSPSGGSIGIGFATPASTVVPVIDQLQHYGEVRRGWARRSDQECRRRYRRQPRSRAGAGERWSKGRPEGAGEGRRHPDRRRHRQVRRQDIKDSQDLPKLVAQAPVGRDVAVVLMRAGKEITKVGPARPSRRWREASRQRLASAGSGALEAGCRGAGADRAWMTFSGTDQRGATEVYHRRSGRLGRRDRRCRAELACAEKRLRPGEVLVEIDQEPVNQPADAASKFKALKSDGKKSALLLVANARAKSASWPFRSTDRVLFPADGRRDARTRSVVLVCLHKRSGFAYKRAPACPKSGHCALSTTLRH